MTTKEHWDAIFAKEQKFTPIKDGEVEMLLERAGHPKTTLDIACGTGGLIFQLSKRGLIVTGADISSVALEKAKQNLETERLHATLVETDFNSPDFAKNLAGPYDIIFMRLAFAFVKDRDGFLETVKKLMAPGGSFVCILPGLLPNGVYDTRQKNISLQKDELHQTLAHHFATVDLISEDISVKPDWPLLTYLCHI